MVNELYEKAWLPLRNYFVPTMKLIEQIRVGSKVAKKYDSTPPPAIGSLDCDKVDESKKEKLRKKS